MNKTVKIVIVGAGVSGISAATKLLRNGFTNVLILEAGSRIGGRVYTVPFADNVIDVGAQWCHGEEGNVVYHMVKNLNLLGSTGDVYISYQCIQSNKMILPDDLSGRLKAIVMGIYDNKKFDMQNYNGSFGSYLMEKFNEALERKENLDIDRIIAMEFLDNYQKFECSYEAADTLFDVSAKGLLHYRSCDGDPVLNWKDKGYTTLLKVLLQSNGSDFGVLKQRIILNKKVKEIVWHKNGKTQTQIKCTDGISIEADHVICTVSLGVLKECHYKMFKPSLPDTNVRAIEGLAIGTVDKIFIEFSEPFWPDDWTGFTLLWCEDDLKEIRKTDNFWMEDMFGFYIVSEQPKVLSGWLIGPSARYAEKLPTNVILSGCMYLLRRFLKWKIPEPTNFLLSTWHSDSNFRGSYSHRSLLTEELKTGACELAMPITTWENKPILQFAGEATHDHFYSTVHGAVESGWREADRLLNFYGSNKASL